MRKAINILTFLLSMAIPAICLIIISSISGFNLAPFIPMFGCLIGLFGYKVMQNLAGKKVASEDLITTKSKVLFIFVMVAIWFIISLVLVIKR
jgi:hypothetical protein